MVWVEQPVGTGFSQGKPNISTEAELAEQFKVFYRNFADTFDLHNRSIYITGESYARQYVPNIASSMLDEKNKEYFNVSGIMNLRPFHQRRLDHRAGPHRSLCRLLGGLFPFNDTIKQQIRDMDDNVRLHGVHEQAPHLPPKGKFPTLIRPRRLRHLRFCLLGHFRRQSLL